MAEQLSREQEIERIRQLLDNLSENIDRWIERPEMVGGFELTSQRDPIRRSTDYIIRIRISDIAEVQDDDSVLTRKMLMDAIESLNPIGKTSGQMSEDKERYLKALREMEESYKKTLYRPVIQGQKPDKVIIDDMPYYPEIIKKANQITEEDILRIFREFKWNL